MGGSLDPKTVTQNAAILAALGEEQGLPLVITSTREYVDFLGTNLQEIQDAAPQHYASRVRRDGTLNAFADPAFEKAVADLGRKNLIMAGLLTDVCLFHTAVAAKQAGYNVIVVADASSTSTPLADTVTYDRLAAHGISAVSTYGILFELYPNQATPEGAKAEQVAGRFLYAPAGA